MIFASVPVLQPPEEMNDTWPQWRGCGSELLIVDNTENRAWDALAAEEGWSYRTFGHNLGVPASWNIARAWFLADDPHEYECLLLFSASVNWIDGLPLAMKQMNDGANWKGCQTVDLGFHAIAWSRGVFDRIGNFDENHWVGYDGDCDWAYRCILAGVLVDDPAPMPKIDMNATCVNGRAITQTAMISNTAATRCYYINKWGGEPSHETYVTPFDSGLPTSWWSPIHRPGMMQINLGETRYR